MSISQIALKRLIEKSGKVAKSDLATAQETARHLGCSITDVLLGRGILSGVALGEILAKYYKMKFVDLAGIQIPIEVLNLIPEDLANQKVVVAFEKKKDKLSLAMQDPKDLEAIELVRKNIGNKIKVIVHVAAEGDLKETLKLYQEKRGEKARSLKSIQEKGESAVSAVERFLEDAIKGEASDIHIEPLAAKLLVRFRIDGVLHDIAAFPKEMHASVVARIKILSELKLDEHRHPQDGQFSFRTKRNEKVSLRVSIIPTVYGEKVVLRILADSLTKFKLEELGLLPEDREVVGRALERTHGMFLVTGPTGSGKTTTLYTTLGLLNNSDVNIVTIEDPVENRINRVNQIQVNSQINLDFASGLRSVLRQDPDIIMVGEIRDKETAVIAVNAAMTGHLVFSSVHANTAAAAPPRMIDLGTEPFLLASTLNMVVAQRLVRILCPKCKKKTALNSLMKERLKEAKGTLSPEIKRSLKKNHSPVGCSSCHNTGFRGRTGIFEILRVGDDIKQMIVSKSSTNAIWKEARKKGAKTMLEDGLIKVSMGITSIEEVFRVISA